MRLYLGRHRGRSYLPPSTNIDITEDNEGGPKNEYAASLEAAIERFGGLLITDEPNGVDIHRL